MSVPAKPQGSRPRATATRARRAAAAVETTSGPDAVAAVDAVAAADADARAASVAADRRLAGVHLRMGSLLLARAELERLAMMGSLDVPGLADLAEVRWRTADLDGAAEAASAHLAAEGTAPVARVVAAEAAAAAGRAGEARSHVAAYGVQSNDELDRLFAGMPRRAVWPSVPETDSDRPSDRGAEPAGSPDRGPDQGLWSLDAPGGPDPATTRPRRAVRRAAPTAVDPARLLEAGRADVRHGDPERLAAGLDRLALALRLDPTLAPTILDAVGRRREPAALVLRGDACRILGRLLEAEAAFAAAAAALGDSTSRASS